MNTLSNWFDLIMVQIGLLPFVVSLISILIFRRWIPKHTSLSIPLGWLAAVLSITTISFFPETAAQKVILLCLLATPIGLCLNSNSLDGPIRRVTFGLLITGALLWSFSGIYSQLSGTDLLIRGICGWAFIHWTLRNLDTQRKHAMRSSVAVLALALGIAAAAAQSSVLISHLSLAMAFSVAAFLVCACFLANMRSTAVLSFAAGLGLALLAYAAVIQNEIIWYALIPFVLVPLVAKIPLPQKQPIWLQASILLLCCGVVSSGGFLLDRFT